MFKAQDGKCAICQEDLIRMCVDHDHTTQTVRGLLCYGCNLALGFLEKRVHLLPKMFAYLSR